MTFKSYLFEPGSGCLGVDYDNQTQKCYGHREDSVVRCTNKDMLQANDYATHFSKISCGKFSINYNHNNCRKPWKWAFRVRLATGNVIVWYPAYTQIPPKLHAPVRKKT